MVTSVSYAVLTFSMNLVKLAFMYKNIDKILGMMSLLRSEPFRIKCREHEELAQTSKTFYLRVFYFCLILGFNTDIFWIVYPLTGAEKTTPFRAWFPFNYEVTVYFYVIYAFQITAAIMNTVICLNLDCFTSSMLIQAGLQCDMMCITLRNLNKFVINENGKMIETDTEDEDEKEYSNRLLKNLIYCIKHHIQIKKWAKDIEDIHFISVFLLFVVGTFVLCASLFEISLVDIMSMEFGMLLSYSSAILTELFLYCYFGNELIYKSEQIFHAIYDCPWLNCDIMFKKTIVLFLIGTQRPIVVYVGGLFTMSLPVYVAILRSSYSYFTLLKNVFIN
ncbi:odorant receptor Or1-like [Aethina tumida]|uniref:odorant receptor Or1-like n=1 Tax=Aethina tumida TaxID=116153 RepID=UPI0021475DC8|nr:odorant receptor Or1-like [Aethina tumida]